MITTRIPLQPLPVQHPRIVRHTLIRHRRRQRLILTVALKYNLILICLYIYDTFRGIVNILIIDNNVLIMLFIQLTTSTLLYILIIDNNVLIMIFIQLTTSTLLYLCLLSRVIV